MYELISLTDNCCYIQSPAKIGLIKIGDSQVCLIDSGNDKDAGKKILRHLRDQNLTLTAIYNTHSHADHIGGNRYLQSQTGCAVYAAGVECDFTNHPILESSLLYGGYPCGDLRHKFLLAQASEAQPLKADMLPDGITAIPLPGHSFDMMGFRTDDDVVFLADCLSSKETLDKYGIAFIYDVAAYLQTLETVKTMNAKLFVPSHAAVTENIVPLAQYNIDKVYEIAQKILALCVTPISFEKLLQLLFTEYHLTMTFEQYALVGSTVRSYLSWLKDNGELTVMFQENYMLWQTV